MKQADQSSLIRTSVICVASGLVLFFLALTFIVPSLFIPGGRQQSRAVSRPSQSIGFLDTSHWRTYRNMELGIGFKYPEALGVSELDTVFDETRGKSIQIRAARGSGPVLVDMSIFQSWENNPESAFESVVGVDLKDKQLVESEVINKTASNYYCHIPGFVEHCASILVTNGRLFYIIYNRTSITNSIIRTLKF